MHLGYANQLEVKRQKVVDALQRIGKIDCFVADCSPSPKTLSYRNKIQLPVKQGAFGLYARASHDLVEVDACRVHCELGEEVYRAVRKVLKGFDLRHLIIKSAINTNEALVILVTDGSSPVSHLGEKVLQAHPSIKGVVHNIHRGKENVILGDTFETLAGTDFIEERLGRLRFRITAASFFQVNPGQAEKLYMKAIECAELSGEETVLDAYCGVGTLSLFFAGRVKRVLGIESIPQAVENAWENAKLNEIMNVSFSLGAAEELIKAIPPVDLVLINPPRKGCERAFLEGVVRLAPKRAIYISCDPATLSRDLAYLQSSGYHVDAVHPFDMFPQTSHVECVAKLTLSMG
jgi:23S rRNA (uracil1939-C5)-methyltransferase